MPQKFSVLREISYLLRKMHAAKIYRLLIVTVVAVLVRFFPLVWDLLVPKVQPEIDTKLCKRNNRMVLVRLNTFLSIKQYDGRRFSTVK